MNIKHPHCPRRRGNVQQRFKIEAIRECVWIGNTFQPRGRVMVDNIKVNIPLASVSSAKSVRPVSHRQNNNQNNLFKNTFKGRQKKKKRKDPMYVKISGRAAMAGNTPPNRHIVAKNKSKEFIQKRTIDIRV